MVTLLAVTSNVYGPTAADGITDMTGARLDGAKGAASLYESRGAAQVAS